MPYDSALKIEERTTDSDGTTEVTLRPRRPLRMKLSLLLVLGVAIFAICFLVMGLLAAAGQSEAFARETLTKENELLYPMGILALFILIVPWRSRLSWNDFRIRIHGMDVDRRKIRRVAIVPAGDLLTLHLRIDGRRRPWVTREEVLWTADVLEKLGYDIEFSEKPI